MSKYSISEFLKEIPEENRKGKLEVLASLLCFSVLKYIKEDDRDESKTIIRDILFLGDLRNSIQWQYVEWAYFLGLYIDGVFNDNEGFYSHISFYRRKSVEYYRTNKDRFVSSYPGLNYNEIRDELKKRIRRRLSGYFLDKNINSYIFYKEQEDIEEEWISIVQCILEKIYLFYTTGQVSNEDIISFKNKAKDFISAQNYRSIAPFVPFEI